MTTYGVCVAITARMKDYKLGVLIGFRGADVKYMPSCLQFPGGKVDTSKEGTREALARELKEETGLDFDPYTDQLCPLPPIANLPFFDNFYDLIPYTFHHTGAADKLLARSKNLEPDKNISWDIMSIDYIIKNNPANMMPGMYEILQRL